jgi:23S rRNA-/tRNA-specific pseudouridylate synthase
LVEVDLVTGRHHQLRTHVAAVGHPLLVDEVYGSLDAFYVSSIKRRYNIKKHVDEKPIISRITMHAYSIEFTHPATKQKMLLQAEYPKDFSATLQILRKYSQ